MKGFTKQRSEGSSWTAFWETRDPATGSRKQHSKAGFKTKTAAQSHLNIVVGKVTSNEWKPDQAITVKALLEDHWLPAQRSRGLRPSTMSQYNGACEWYIIPQLGGTKARALTPAHVSELVEHMMSVKSKKGREGLSSRTAQVAVAALKAATKWATVNGLLSRDPLVGVAPPRRERKAMSSWSTDEARAFLAHVRGDRLEVAWALLLTRGLRRGELCGLRWDAVNLTDGTITIQRTLISVGGEATESIPKTTAGRRTIPLDAHLVTLLRSHEVAQKADRLQAGEAWQGVVHVIANEIGKPYHPDYIGDRFEKLVRAAGLPRIRLHDLRHTACSLMLASGVPVKVVQEMAGHSSPAITLSLYTHTTPSMGRDAGAALSASLLG